MLYNILKFLFEFYKILYINIKKIIKEELWIIMLECYIKRYIEVIDHFLHWLSIQLRLYLHSYRAIPYILI